MSISVDDVEYIDVEKVPTSKRRTKWDDLFKSIPKGKAAVLNENKARPSSVRQALQRRRKRGLYLNYTIVVTGKKGERTIYVVNKD